MAGYYFRAVSTDGQVRSGTIAAPSERAVVEQLRRQGLVPVYVGTQPVGRRQRRFHGWGLRRRRNVLIFTQELATLLAAGVPLDRALAITADLAEPAFRTVVTDVLRHLKAGKSLADSLATHPECFSDLYVNMVRAGEASGALSSIFQRLAEFEKTRDELRNYIISSMIYPALLSLVGLVSILVLIYFVVPRFAVVFEQSHMPMPLPTKVLLEASRWLRTYGWIGLLMIGGALGFLHVYIRTPRGRFWWDSVRLRIPLLGEALRRAETARFAAAMGTLIGNGVPLVQSLRIAAAILNNRRMAASIDRVAQSVKRGEGIARPLARTGEFPPLVSHLLTVGEETGQLDIMFRRMAETYDEETRTAIKRFTALFEPLIILVMGVMVGVLVLSMLLAITSINQMAV